MRFLHSTNIFDAVRILQIKRFIGTDADISGACRAVPGLKRGRSVFTLA